MPRGIFGLQDVDIRPKEVQARIFPEHARNRGDAELILHGLADAAASDAVSPRIEGGPCED